LKTILKTMIEKTKVRPPRSTAQEDICLEEVGVEEVEEEVEEEEEEEVVVEVEVEVEVLL